MNIDQLVSLVTTMLAISLAAERLVTALKSAFPKWLAEEKKTAVNGEDKVGDGPRRAAVIVLAFGAAYITSALVAASWDPRFRMHFGAAPHEMDLPLAVVALLATGGSAFWNDLLGYTKAVKDIRGQDREQQALALHQQAQATGVAVDPAGRARILADDSSSLKTTLTRLRSKPQPTFPPVR